MIAPIRLLVDDGPAGLEAVFDWSEAVTPPAFFMAFEALYLVKLGRMGTRHPISPNFVGLPELPEDLEPYEAFVGCRIRRADHITVRFRPEDARRPFLTDNSAMWDIFEPQLRKRLADLEGSATYRERTRAVLLEALPSGEASVDVVAQRLALSSRTLQRRLKDEGTSFNSVMQETRKGLSLHYIENTQLSYGEIAYLLGFNEPNSFFRAFQGWTGTTPESLRQHFHAAN